MKEWKSTVPHTNQTGHTRDKTCGFCFLVSNPLGLVLSYAKLHVLHLKMCKTLLAHCSS